MAKKKHKDKELARLRREVEVLRAQVARQGPQLPTSSRLQGTKKAERSKERPPSAKQPRKAAKQTPLREVDPEYIKKDLLKSGILTIAACTIVGGLYIFRYRIPFL